MSISRQISFKANDRDKLILKYFDENGKSDIAKLALWEYMERKISPTMLMQAKEIVPESPKLIKKSSFYK